MAVPMAATAAMVLLLLLAAPRSTNASETLLIKGGTVVNHDRKFEADVLVQDGFITRVEQDIKVEAGPSTRVIDASGLLVMPGGIDPHTHLDMPFMGSVACDDFASGQAAAAAGGTTMHIDFALPVDHDLERGFEAWSAKAQKGCLDYGFHMAVTKWNDKTSADMGKLAQKGVNSFKFFMAYKNALMVTDEELIAGFARARDLGALPMVHAENGEAVAWGQQRMVELGVTGPEGHALSRPSYVEDEATGRAIHLAHMVGVPLYVVHVMSSGAADAVAQARKQGQRVVGEAVASGLALNESHLWHPDFRHAAQYVMSPPIRGEGHRTALLRAMAGGALQLVATDHAVFNSTQKAAGRHDFRLIPNGVNGIEERMHVVWEELVNSGLITPEDFVRVTSTAAAQLFNLYPRKGHIGVGSDADIAILDPRAEHTISAATHHSRMDTNVYEGKRIKGKVVVTVSRGRVVWEGGRLSCPPHSSRYVPGPLFGPLFEGMGAQRAAALTRPYGATPVNRGGVGGDGTRDEL